MYYFIDVFCSKRAFLSIRDMSLYFITGFNEGVELVSEIFELFLELLIGKWCLQTEKREGMFSSFCMEFGEIVRNLYARIDFYGFFVSLRLVI